MLDFDNPISELGVCGSELGVCGSELGVCGSGQAREFLKIVKNSVLLPSRVINARCF